MKPIFHTKKILAVILLVAIAFASLYVLLYREVKKINTKSANTIEELAFEKDKTNRVAGLKKLATDIASDIELLNKAYVGKEELVHFIEKIESLGVKSGVDVSISSITPEVLKEKTVASSTEAVRLRVTMNGPWSGVYYFNRMIEELPYKLNIARVSLDMVGNGEDKKGPPIWNGSMEFVILKEK